MAAGPRPKPRLLLDGGLGTPLEDQHGIRFSSAQTPWWSSPLLAAAPDTLLEAQARFVRAGAHVVLSAAYRASFHRFRKTAQPPSADTASAGEPRGFDRPRAEAAMRLAVQVARSAFPVGPPSRVGGPQPGRLWGHHGPEPGVLRPVPSRHVAARPPPRFPRGSPGSLPNGPPPTWNDIDLVAFETLPVVAEVRPVRSAMQARHARGERPKRFWVSCVFPNQDDNLPDGTDVPTLVRAMLAG